jgi:cysteine desulfurase
MIRPSPGDATQIYADYQASTPIDPLIAQKLSTYFAMYAANPHADDHSMGWESGKACDDAAARLARGIGCSADELIFTSGATEANNLAMIGLAARRRPDRRKILVSGIEHKSVLEAAAVAAKRFGCVVEILAVDKHGRIDLASFERSLDEDVLLVSVMAANNEIGALQPSPEIGRLCEKTGTLFHCDAAQALTAGPVDVESWGAHLVSLSAHKIYGPKGVGALFVRRDLQSSIEPLIVGGGQQQGLRAGTLPTPLCVAFADAAEAMTGRGAETEWQRVATLRDSFAAHMLSHGGIHLNGPPLSARHPSNCNLRFDGVEAKLLLAKAQPRLAASTGSACTSGTPEPSHVLRAIGLTDIEAECSIRFSFGRFSTEEEISTVSELMLSIYEASRQIERVA